MRSTRPAGGLLLAGLCTMLAGCGGGESAPTPADPAERERAAAAAAVGRLNAAVRQDDRRAACRSLTLATRRVVALTGRPGVSCTGALEDFLDAYGLREALPGATALRATVTGPRALVRGTGLPQTLTATRNAGGWRVSLIQVPGVRGDVTAARACGRYLADADALGLPPFDAENLLRRLRTEGRLIDRLRRRLMALPAGGPPRAGLPGVLRALAEVRAGLMTRARRVASGDPVQHAMLATARGDRLVRTLLAEEASKARVACPLTATQGSGLAARRSILDAACRSYGEAIDTLDAAPESAAEAQAALQSVDVALGRLDHELGRAPVPRRLRWLRRETREAVRLMQAAVAALGESRTEAELDVAGRRVEGRGTQIDAALIRLGATCLDAGSTPAPAPRERPMPPDGVIES